ncbi:MAG: hypothetical protein NTY66_04055 [Candidatus Vogelbacteria bacterium]|nr:hypothetical protein [Candidatus Vogelbacteria bacterium]
MNYVLLGILCMVLGIIPALIERRFFLAAIVGVIEMVILPIIFYANATPFLGPYWGTPGIWVLGTWILTGILSIIASLDGDCPRSGPPTNILMMVVAVGMFIVAGFQSSAMLNASRYAALIGQPEERNWTMDVQPKDPEHIRLVSHVNAEYLAKSVLSKAGAIGSQYQVNYDNMTLQHINAEFWYVAPLDFASWGVWNSGDGAPGYIMVSATDPDREPILKMLPQGGKIKYSPGAWFGDNLERYLRNNGFRTKGLTEFSYEIDEQGNDWWVVSVYDLTIGYSGAKALGVAIVDPTTGGIKYEPIGKIEAWVDRAIPGWVVQNYLTWWGMYKNGWSNTMWWGAKKELLRTDVSHLIYASGNRSDWVTGITSNNANDHSLVMFVYTDSNTGQSVLYRTNGGFTDNEVVKAIDTNSEIKYKGLTGSDPQLYNLYGVMASVLPLNNSRGIFQGVAIVPIHDTQRVAWDEKSLAGALVQFQKMLSLSASAAIEATAQAVTVEGVIERIGASMQKGDSSFFARLADQPFILTLPANDPVVPLTEKGDRVKVTFVESKERVVGVKTFVNLTLPLRQSTAESRLEQKAETVRTEKEKGATKITIRDRLDRMSPEELKALDERTSVSRGK